VPPATGGGGTAGFQHGWLLAVGAAAFLAGIGSLIYRRKVTRNR
jgi:LPXTG-motif cell wall-anchored protein